MTHHNVLIGILFAYIILREVVFMTTIQKMINKIMSRNYHEFQVADRLNNQPKGFTLKEEDQSEPEDLNSITI